MHSVIEVLEQALAEHNRQAEEKRREFEAAIEHARQFEVENAAKQSQSHTRTAEEGPDLINLPIRSAIMEYLDWCASRGRSQIKLGELEEALGRHKVLMSDGRPLSESHNPWKVICNTLTAAGNQVFFRVNRRSKHLTRSDTVELVHQGRKRA